MNQTPSAHPFFPVLGVALVVANTRGHQVVFHTKQTSPQQPQTLNTPQSSSNPTPIPPQSKGLSTPTLSTQSPSVNQTPSSSYSQPHTHPNPNALSSSHTNAYETQSVISNQGSAHSNHHSGKASAHPPTGLAKSDTVFGLSPSLFASLLCPKSALCNQLFEVSVDRLLFVGFPVLLDSSSPTKTTATLKKNTSDSQMLSHTSAESGGFASASPSLMHSTLSSAAQTPASLQHSSHRSDETIACYTVVLVLPSRVATLHPSLLQKYRKVVSRLASALQHEQNRVRYVTRQIHLLLSLRDADSGSAMESFGDVQSALQPLPNHRHDHAAQLQASYIDLQDHHQLSIRRSRLAAELESVYLSLRDEHSVHLFVNGWIEIAISLKPKNEHPLFPIRPYQTLVLTSSEAKILEMLPDDCSPGLIKLIQSCNPRKSFQELQLDLEIPLPQLFKYAAHLVYWGYGIIVDTLTRHNIYVLSKAIVNETLMDTLAVEFSKITKAHSLTELLQRFSQPKLLGDHIHFMNQELNKEFVQIVIFLLKNKLLVQLHTYVHLILDEQEVLAHLRASGLERKGSQLTMGMVQESIADHDLPAARSRLRDYEARYIESIADESSEAKLLRKLCPYFRGRHHLEEIMWRENISRNDIALVLAKYRDILVCAMHA